MSYSKWGENSLLSQAEYVIALVTMVCVLYLVYKQANLKVSISGMANGEANYLRFMGLDSGRGGRDSMVGALEPPVFWTTNAELNNNLQASVGQETDGDDGSQWIDETRVYAAGTGSSQVHFNQATEGLRGDRRSYGRSGLVGDRQDPLAAAMAGGNASL